ncbi:MAG: DNA internalization-related competence protein ComEC/Rec2, partial [Methylococcus sp.]
GVVLWLPALLHQPERPEPGGYRLTLLDVGQGLSAVIETRHRTLVFDTGAKLSDSFDMGSAVIEPYLRHRGLARIDALVVSHGDDDHIGGARSLLEAFPVGQVVTSVPQRLAGAVTPTACRVGQSWQWDGVRFDLLGPITPSEKDNDNSCVLRVSGAGGSVLLTGDIEAGAEHELVTMHGEDLKSDVLIVPHHGSRTSSTSGFLDWVQPRLALIPAGHLNRFGFPHPDVVRRYRERGITVMTAGETGAITLDADPKTGLMDPVAYREVYRRYWSVP